MPNKIPVFRPRALRAKPLLGGLAPHDHLAGRSTKFTSDRRWRKVRAAKLRKDPLCEDCLAKGLTEPATQAHHRIKRRDDPSGESWLDEDNLVSLCQSCHSRRTGQDE